MQLMDQVDKILTRGVAEVLPNKEGLAKLMRQKKIRVYLGIDPTGTKLHLGHTIALKKLGQFADLGHVAILLIGTGTVLVGDPSQRQSARPKITNEEIAQNIKTWKEQAGKILDFDKIQIKHNGDWLLKLTYPEIVNIAANITAVQLFKRDMFQKRLDRGDTVLYHETLYPLMQGYDSVVMDVDLEIGGTDQTFNMLIGRELQKKMKGREKFVLSTPLVNGIDNQPMSKTSGNCIWLTDNPDEMYGKIMSIPDILIREYWELLTDLDADELSKLKPLDAKKRLALEITKIYHTQDAAQTAQNEFEKVFQEGGQPQQIPAVKITTSPVDIINLLVENKLVNSKSQAKRLLDDDAIEVDGEIVKNSQVDLKNGQVIRVGKKKFVKIEVR